MGKRRKAVGNKSQSLVELIIGVAIAAVIAGSIVGALILSVRVNRESTSSRDASSLGQELLDKTRSLSEGDWPALYNLSDKSSSSMYYVTATTSP